MQQKKGKKKERNSYITYIFLIVMWTYVFIMWINKKFFQHFQFNPHSLVSLTPPLKNFWIHSCIWYVHPKKPRLQIARHEDRFLLNAANFLELNFSRIYREIVLAVVRPNIHLRNCKWLSCRCITIYENCLAYRYQLMI